MKEVSFSESIPSTHKIIQKISSIPLVNFNGSSSLNKYLFEQRKLEISGIKDFHLSLYFTKTKDDHVSLNIFVELDDQFKRPKHLQFRIILNDKVFGAGCLFGFLTEKYASQGFRNCLSYSTSEYYRARHGDFSYGLPYISPYLQFTLEILVNQNLISEVNELVHSRILLSNALKQLKLLMHTKELFQFIKLVTENQECSVCLENVETMEKSNLSEKSCPNLHLFHLGCVQSLSECPLCRTKI